ncbi:MAG TPA: lanthionine synthetase C family protein, partial [Kofleriaceae bacterium]
TPGGPGLAGGAAGMAVCAAYVDDAATRRLWQVAADALENTALPPGLFDGVTGIGWATAHLRDRLFEDGDDPCEAVDDFVLDRVSHPGFGRPFDLGAGLVGFGIYALERLPVPACAQILAHIVERLGEIVEPAGPAGCHLALRTPPRELIPLRRAQFPDGWFNLGLAHGVPGVIALLAGIRAAAVRPAETTHLLDALVGWLLAQARPDAPARYAHWVGDAEPDRTQLAWCYGDLGIAAALHHAGVACNRPSWCGEALELARAAAQRSIETIPGIDAGLCHGAIGAAHGFARLHHLTGDGSLRQAAADWYSHALALRTPGRGLAGWRAYQGPGNGGDDEWISDAGLLSGAAGIALSLHAATTAREPSWDRALLWSVRGC